MTWLTTPPDCAQEDQFCRAVLRATDNRWLATAANWLVAKPLAILTIVVLAFVVRWAATKFIRRLTSRAAGGVFQTNVLRGREGAEELRLAAERRGQRAETMASVLSSITSFGIFALASVMVL